MSQLPARARTADDKEGRRRALLLAARALLEASSFADLKMADVARGAGVAKGTVFLYFATKEALCVDLLATELEDWFDALDAELDRRRRWTPARIVQVVVGTVSGRVLLTRLLALLANVLERNIELAQVIRFKKQLLYRLTVTGERLDHRLSLPAGTGARLLLRLNVVVVGLRTMADAGPVATKALARPDLAPLIIDFAEELPILVAALLRGLLNVNENQGASL